MRHVKIVEGLNAAIEDFGFALGEARDFIEREEPHICDLIDDVAFGKLSSSEAKFIVLEIFSRARKDWGEWNELRARVAVENGFPYLHESLKVARVVSLIPEGAA